jgi:hypothetical protein
MELQNKLGCFYITERITVIKTFLVQARGRDTYPSEGLHEEQLGSSPGVNFTNIF